MKVDHKLWALPILAIVAAAGCGRDSEDIKPVRPVRTLVVGEGAAFSGRVFPGRAEAVQSVDIAFEVQGKLIERPVLVGDHVKQGQVLAKLDPRDYENAVASAKARLERALAYRERIEKAAKSGAVSEQDLTDARAQYDVAAANVRVQEKALADTQIVAPFEGTIVATYVENFQNVQAKQVVLRMLDMTAIELRIDIPETLITLVPQVEDITVTFDAFPDHPVSAQIKEVGQEASTTTRTYPVTLIMIQPEAFDLLPGMTGQARGRLATVDPDQSDVVQVPAAAVLEEGGKEYVWIVAEPAMTVSRREIRTQSVNAAGVLIKGVAPLQRIVTAGAHFLAEGEQVRLLDETQREGTGS